MNDFNNFNSLKNLDNFKSFPKGSSSDNDASENDHIDDNI